MAFLRCDPSLGPQASWAVGAESVIKSDLGHRSHLCSIIQHVKYRLRCSLVSPPRISLYTKALGMHTGLEPLVLECWGKETLSKLLEEALYNFWLEGVTSDSCKSRCITS